MLPTPIIELKSKLFHDKEVKVLMKRDDLNHPVIMGNKWRKLKYNLIAAKEQKASTLVTYGGAYSNHILATAAAASESGLASVGIIRGEELRPDSNPTLQEASRLGMKFYFVDRTEFRMLKNEHETPTPIDGSYILPEGGTNQLAIQGCAEIVDEINVEFDTLVTSIGTGGTFAGMLKGLGGEKQLIGFSALKGKWVSKEIQDLLIKSEIPHRNFEVFEDDVFGGYGRYNQNLIQFILEFTQEYNILVDPIYTAKMCFRICEMVENDQIAAKSTILLVHTGGLQGIKGFNQRFGVDLPMPNGCVL